MRHRALLVTSLMAACLFQAEGAPAGGADPKPADPGKPDPTKPATNPGTTPATPALDPTIKSYVDEQLGGLRKENESLRGELGTFKQQQAEAAFAGQVTAAAKEAAAKDQAYFAYLAAQEKAAKKDAFDLGAFTNDLKTKRPDLFEQPKPATTTAGVPAMPANEVTALQAQLTEARAKGNVNDVLRLTTRLQQAGVKI